jgi:hypothetical protein
VLLPSAPWQFWHVDVAMLSAVALAPVFSAAAQGAPKQIVVSRTTSNFFTAYALRFRCNG